MKNDIDPRDDVVILKELAIELTTQLILHNPPADLANAMSAVIGKTADVIEKYNALIDTATETIENYQLIVELLQNENSQLKEFIDAMKDFPRFQC